MMGVARGAQGGSGGGPGLKMASLNRPLYQVSFHGGSRGGWTLNWVIQPLATSPVFITSPKCSVFVILNPGQIHSDFVLKRCNQRT